MKVFPKPEFIAGMKLKFKNRRLAVTIVRNKKDNKLSWNIHTQRLDVDADGYSCIHRERLILSTEAMIGMAQMVHNAMLDERISKALCDERGDDGNREVSRD